MQIGAYDTAWPDIHMMPEEGVAAHVDVRGGLMIPVHWGTFTLAFHPWGEPVDRVWREAKDRGVTLAVPRPGERVDVDNPPSRLTPWWTAALRTGRALRGLLVLAGAYYYQAGFCGSS